MESATPDCATTDPKPTTTTIVLISDLYNDPSGLSDTQELDSFSDLDPDPDLDPPDFVDDQEGSSHDDIMKSESPEEPPEGKKG